MLRRLGDNPKIAILKPGGLGDFLVITPALRALRRALPRATITVITLPWMVDFCQRYPQLDHVQACPPFPGMVEGPTDSEQLAQFFTEAQAEKYDLGIQWAGNGRHSNHFLKRLGAQYTLGFQDPDALELDLSLPFDLQRHEALRYLDTLTLLGIDCRELATGLHLDTPLLEEDFAELRRVWPPFFASANRFLGINPSSGDRMRRWPASRFAAVADQLLEEYAFTSAVLLGTDHQREQTRAVQEDMLHADRTIDMAGRLSLGGLAALLTKLDILITVDSGPAHLAAATGTPEVIIFGAGPPTRWNPVSWVWQRPLADWQARCRSYVPNCCHDLPVCECLDKITVDQVLWEARRLMRLATLIEPPNKQIMQNMTAATD